MQWKYGWLVDRLLVIDIHINKIPWGTDITRERGCQDFFRAIIKTQSSLKAFSSIPGKLTTQNMSTCYLQSIKCPWSEKYLHLRRHYSKANGLGIIKYIPLAQYHGEYLFSFHLSENYMYYI